MSGRADLDPAAFEDDDRRLGASDREGRQCRARHRARRRRVRSGAAACAVRRRGLDGGDRAARRGRPARALRAARGRRGRFRRPVVPRRAARPGGERAGLCGGCRRDVSRALRWRRCGSREKAPLIVLRNDPNRVGGRRDRGPLRLEGRDAAAFLAARVMGRPHHPGVGNPGRRAETGRPALADKIVLIGSSAPEAGAFLPIAGAALAPTVQIQAEAIEQILTASFLKRPDFVVLVGGAGHARARACWRWRSPCSCRRPGRCWRPSALPLAGSAAVATAFRAYGLLIDPIGPAAVADLRRQCDGVRSLHPHARAEDGHPAEVRALRAAGGRRPARARARNAAARRRAARGHRAAHRRRGLLVDDREVRPEHAGASARRLFRSRDRADRQPWRHGRQDRSAMRCSASSTSRPTCRTTREAAVRCARAIVASTEAFRRRREVAALGFGRTRCGIETGMAIVGDVGGRRRLDYTVYGPVVNKAARFQEANKALRSTICIGPAAAAAVEERRPAASARPHRCPRHGGLRGGVRAVGGRAFRCDVRRSYDEAVAISRSASRDRARRDPDRACRAGCPTIRSSRMWLERLAALTLRSRSPSPPRCAERPIAPAAWALRRGT